MFAWELVFPLGVLILLIGLVYGFWQYKTRNRANDRIADRVVRERYEDPPKGEK